MSDYIPNERVVDRAVELWIKALRNPVYNNGGGLASFVASAIAHTLDKNNTDEVLQKFGAELKKLLMSGTVREYRDGSTHTFYPTTLNVDYGPNATLSEAAEAAGLKMQFPWKTDMWLNSNGLSFSSGYGASSIRHYPTPMGHWVVTTLAGSVEDVRKLVEYADAVFAFSGFPPDFVRMEICEK